MTNHAKCGVPAADVFVQGGRTGALLLHRLGGTPSDFGSLLSPLTAAGMTISCPQIYGHGGSRALLAATTAVDWLRSVREAWDDLAPRCDRRIVMAHGEGAVLALRLVREATPTPDALILLAPCLWPDGWNAPWYESLLRLISLPALARPFRLDETAPFGIKDDALRQRAIDEMRADGRPHDDIFGRSACSALEIARLAGQLPLAEITLPVLIIHPRDGDRGSLTTAIDLQCRLGGRVDTLVLDDSYSFVMRDRQQDAAVERIGEFLLEIVAASRA